MIARIIAGEGAYLMRILTLAPDSVDDRQLAADLASALWSTRSTLQLQKPLITQQ